EARLGERGADAVRLLAQPASAVSLAVRRVVKAHAAAAAALGLMHGEVGREEQVGSAARMIGEHGYPRARGERERVALPQGRHPANERDDGLGARRGFGRGGSGKEDRDLVAAHPAGGLSSQEGAAKSLGHGAKVFVSREEPVGVVQSLEVVEPDDEERERPSEKVSAGQLALELEVELLSIREAR